MNKKMIIVSVISTILLFLGNHFVFSGLLNGAQRASEHSRPVGATSWSIPQEAIKAYTYAPIVLGVSLILISIVFLAIVLNKWLRES